MVCHLMTVHVQSKQYSTVQSKSNQIKSNPRYSMHPMYDAFDGVCCSACHRYSLKMPLWHTKYIPNESNSNSSSGQKRRGTTNCTFVSFLTLPKKRY
mmetsp:Transcript_53145/g.60446  ORF Transcript_53145/g.60446 Transcript_53145/m.60446 type:complete len:97 (-) Transcript_53145:1085-1375(-)